MKKSRNLNFVLDINNNYYATVLCPFCNKPAMYISHEDTCVISGCAHIYKTKRIEYPLGLDMIFKK